MSAVLPLVVELTAAVASDSPVPPAEEDVTPGIVGFAVTVVLMVAVVALAVSLVRRVRRVNYRAEIRRRLDEERRDAELGEADGQFVDAADGAAEAGAADGEPEGDGPARAS